MDSLYLVGVAVLAVIAFVFCIILFNSSVSGFVLASRMPQLEWGK